MNAPQPITPRLMSVRSAAKWLELGQSTVYAMVASGEIPHVAVGRVKRIDIRDLEAWIEHRKRAADG
jgi:excisionase family DNA binding protein